MTNKAPISMCLITRDDAHIEPCIKSFWDYVEEVVVVVTANTDLATLTTLTKLKAQAPCQMIIDTFADCNDPVTNKIIDFSLARNKSLQLATQPWLMWIDSDDIMVGADKLAAICAKPLPTNLDTIQYLMPYEYGYDQHGTCILRHYRERLVYGKQFNKFINPVHEVMVASGRSAFDKCEDVIFKHQRQFNPKPQDPGRNLRILQKHFEKPENKDDTRNKYYIGLEYFNHNDYDNSIKYLTDYIATSGWEDERAMACIKMVEIGIKNNQPPLALEHAFKLLQMKHNWFESYYNLCKVYYLMGQMDKAAYYGKLALVQPPTQTLLFVNEGERFDLHIYLNIALNAIGDVQGALDSCNAGLKGLPGHPNLINNKTILERHLGIKHPAIPVGKAEGKLSVVFVTATSVETWSPDTIKTTGIGGSETLLVENAKNLSDLGHKVVVYAACDGYFDGVEYQNFQKFGNISCDVLVVSRYTQFLQDQYNVEAKLKLLWLHDIMAHQATNELLLKADRILCLSQWHKDFVIKHHNLHPDHVVVTRNGINLDRFSQSITKDPHKCINSSSPDRSWPILLNIWPEIRRQVPDATLELFYGFGNWKAMAQHDQLQTDLINRLEKQIEDLKPSGVTMHGRVNQDQLAKEFLSSTCWLYPTFFTETSCISAMEAIASDCWLITSPIAALNETCANYDKTIFIPGEWTSKEYMDKFVAETVRVLNEKV